MLSMFPNLELKSTKIKSYLLIPDFGGGSKAHNIICPLFNRKGKLLGVRLWSGLWKDGKDRISWLLVVTVDVFQTVVRVAYREHTHPNNQT